MSSFFLFSFPNFGARSSDSSKRNYKYGTNIYIEFCESFSICQYLTVEQSAINFFLFLSRLWLESSSPNGFVVDDLKMRPPKIVCYRPMLERSCFSFGHYLNFFLFKLLTEFSPSSFEKHGSKFFFFFIFWV